MSLLPISLSTAKNVNHKDHGCMHALTVVQMTVFAILSLMILLPCCFKATPGPMHMGAGSLMAQHLLLAYPGEQRSLRHNPDDDDVPLHQHTQTTLQAQ